MTKSMPKKEFVCVEPKSSKAKNRFANMMDKLHTCEVEQRSDGKLFLASINKKYFFWIPENGDDHWQIVK